MSSRLFLVALLRAQRQRLRLRSVGLVVLCAEWVAFAFLTAGLGLWSSLVAAVVFGISFLFWPSIIGVVWLIATRTARFAVASHRLLVRWKDSRFRYGLRTVFVVLTGCAIIAHLSRLLYDAMHPQAYMAGQVIFLDTNQPAPHVLVRAQSVRSTTYPSVYGFAETRTDENGSFRLPMLPATKYNIWAEKEGWTCVAVEAFEPAPNKLVNVPDVQLVSGGWITGRVINAKTGLPVRPVAAGAAYKVLVETGGTIAAQIGLYGPSRPKSGAAIESVSIEDDGSFRIRAAPGENLIYVMHEGSWDFDLPTAMRVNVQEGLTREVELRIMPTSPTWLRQP